MRYPISVLIALAAAALPMLAAAQANWPTRPVRFVVSQSAGGSIDIAARTLGQKLSDSLGRQFVVENRPGANGMIAVDAAAKAGADGYTFLMSSPGPLTINRFVYKDVTYDTLKDFAPVTQTTSIAFLMVVSVSSPYKTVQEVVAAAKSRPGGIKYGSAGPGNQSHLAPEMLGQASGATFLHVPYKGEAPAIIDLLSGQIDFIIGTMPALLQQVKAGKLRALAVCQKERSRAAPEVPTMTEAGYPAVEVTGWTGLLAPAGTSPEVVVKLRDEVAKILGQPELAENLAKQGAEPVGSTPGQFASFIRAETEKWGAAVRAAGLKPE